MDDCTVMLPTKKHKLSTDQDPSKYDFMKADQGDQHEHDHDQVISNLITWMKGEKFKISSKVKISKMSCSRYGLFACSNIEKNETIFTIPRSSLLWEQTCSISQLLLDSTDLNSESGWVKLIICLMHEFTNPQSRWRSYLDFAPTVQYLDQPMFWTEQEIDLYLKGTGCDSHVKRDISEIEREFKEVVKPFLNANRSVGFSDDVHNLSLYKHMVAFVMAYSFTDENSGTSPMMVPLADVLNHVANNNAELRFSDRKLEMVTVEVVKAGEEIYNTYGHITNSQLLQMYGFVETYPDNIYDVVDIPVTTLHSSAQRINVDCVSEKILWLQQQGVDAISVGEHGVMNVDEFRLIMRTFAMSKSQFDQRRISSDDDEVWSTDNYDDDDDDEFEVFSAAAIANKLSDSQKLMLRICCEIHLERYGDVTNDEDDGREATRKRKKVSRDLATGQKQILKKFVLAMTS